LAKLTLPLITKLETGFAPAGKQPKMITDHRRTGRGGEEMSQTHKLSCGAELSVDGRG
jgi:hypothetical protein